MVGVKLYSGQGPEDGVYSVQCTVYRCTAVYSVPITGLSPPKPSAGPGRIPRCQSEADTGTQSIRSLARGHGACSVMHTTDKWLELLRLTLCKPDWGFVKLEYR